MSSDVIREMVSFRLNLLVRPQDFSIGKVLSNQSYFELDGHSISTKDAHSSVLKKKFCETSEEIHNSLTTSLSQEMITKEIDSCELQVKQSLETGQWVDLFPGKELIELVAKQLGVSNIISLQNSIIKELSSDREHIDPEISEIFEKISQC